MGQREKLSDQTIDTFLAGHPGWERAGAAGNIGGGSATRSPDTATSLARTFTFDSYAAGIAFVVRVGFAAEARDHHPDLEVGWRRVRVVWTTHDAGGITALDLELAQQSDALARS